MSALRSSSSTTSTSTSTSTSPRLARAEAARIVALVVVAIALVAPALARRLAGPDAPTYDPWPSCPSGAHREPSRGLVACGPGSSPLDARRAFLLGTRLDLNRATRAELELVPGIGPSLAARIVDDREARGPFFRIEALERVRGIGPKLLARLAPFVTLEGAPPDATAAGPRSSPEIGSEIRTIGSDDGVQ